MVQAIMAGNKRMTRRDIKNKEVLNMIDKGLINNAIALGKYRIGDILWVRETFQQHCIETDTDENWAATAFESTGQYVYKADDYQLPKDSVAFGKWKPGIHMPKTACRLFLKIKSIRIERLNEISHEDCIAEGIEKGPTTLYRNYISKQDRFEYNPWLSFMSLWISINGTVSYDSSPYVWVIEFEKCEKPDNFLLTSQ